MSCYVDKNGNKCLNVVSEFTALRSKCYSVKTLESIVKKCKGLKKTSLNRIKHEDFVESNLFGGKIDGIQNVILSKKHDVFTTKIKIDGIITVCYLY
jgi:hypothetical protein